MCRPIALWQHPNMVGIQVLSVDALEGQRWDAALSMLETGDGAVGLQGLVLSRDLATDKAAPLLHIEIECPFDPSQVGRAPRDRLHDIATRSLAAARQTIGDLAQHDRRFADLVAESGQVYELVHRYGMGALLVATAGASGDLSWR